MESRIPQIELELQGRRERGGRIPLRTFAIATDALTDLLVQLTTAQRVNRHAVDWFVDDLQIGSTVLRSGAAARSADGAAAARTAIRMTIDVVERLETERSVRGLVTFAALERVRTMGGLLNDGAGRLILRDIERKTEAELTKHGTHQATVLLAEKRMSYGSVEGRVETISVHEARPYFNVFDVLDDHAIKCICNDELLLLAQDALMRKNRVRATGTISRRFDGLPETMDVDRMRIIPPNEDLPQPDRIRGIDPDITGGMTVGKWLRKRNG